MKAVERYETELQNELKKHLDFLYAATDAVKDVDEAIFECPVCGAMARATKDSTDGHVRAYCNKCLTNFMQ